MGLFDGPLSQFGGSSRNPMLTGARAGMALGPAGMAVGALAGWLYGRYGTQTGRIAGQQTANSMLGNDISRTQDQIWGNQPAQSPQQAPQDPGYSMDPNATSMGPPAPVDENGPGVGGGPSARRDAGFGDFHNSGLYGVSNMTANGQQVINGENGMDPNGGYLYNRRGVGG